MQRVQDFCASPNPSTETGSGDVLHPRGVRWAQEWSLSSPCSDNFVAFGIGLDAPPPWLDPGGAWCGRIADLVLGDRERALWEVSRKPEPRRREWLLGRLAAKEATCEYLWRQHRVRVTSASFEILPDPNGRPVVTGLSHGNCPPVVSISHAEGAAIAIAGDGAALEGIGIDLERRGRMTPRMEALVFTAAERQLLDVFDGEPRAEWGARLWSAKEAVAKFTACDVVPTSRALRVVHVDAASGLVLLQHRNERDAVVTFQVSTAPHGPWIVATCVSASMTSS